MCSKSTCRFLLYYWSLLSHLPKSPCSNLSRNFYRALSASTLSHLRNCLWQCIIYSGFSDLKCSKVPLVQKVWSAIVANIHTLKRQHSDVIAQKLIVVQLLVPQNSQKLWSFESFMRGLCVIWVSNSMAYGIGDTPFSQDQIQELRAKSVSFADFFFLHSVTFLSSLSLWSRRK